MDEDCDGTTTIQRLWVADFEGSSAGPGFTMVRMGGPLSSPPVPDAVSFHPQGVGFNAVLGLAAPLWFESGELTIVADISDISGTIGCTAKAAWSGAGFDSASMTVSNGPQTVALGVPPQTDADIWIECAGNSGTHVKFNWLTIANGPYLWPPISELKVDYSDLAMPGGG